MSVVLEVVSTDAVAELSSEFTDLPLRAVVDRAAIAEQGIRLFDLRAAGLAAPKEIELSVALLQQAGVLGLRDMAGDDQSTMELLAADKLRWSVESLMDRTRNQGISSSAYSVLVLFDEGRRMTLEGLLTDLRHRDVPPLLTQLKRRSGGSLIYTTDLGRLALHIQQLDSDSLSRLRPILPACNAVLVWLAPEGGAALVGDLAAQLDQLKNWVDVLVITEKDGSLETATELAEDRPSWRISTHQPRSIGTLLRYFPGPEA